MTKVFDIKDLELIVEPNDLIEVLDSLVANGYLSSYYYNWEVGEVELEVTKSAEVQEVMEGFSEFKNKKPKGDAH